MLHFWGPPPLRQWGYAGTGNRPRFPSHSCTQLYCVWFDMSATRPCINETSKREKLVHSLHLLRWFTHTDTSARTRTRTRTHAHTHTGDAHKHSHDLWPTNCFVVFHFCFFLLPSAFLVCCFSTLFSLLCLCPLFLRNIAAYCPFSCYIFHGLLRWGWKLWTVLLPMMTWAVVCCIGTGKRKG